MGVRIFPDGRDAQSKEPLAVARRGYRSQRKNLDRYLYRMKRLIDYLTETDLLPMDEQRRAEVFKLNPYQLRTKALDEKLEPAEFARAIIHLAKRRGFRSNRKVMSDKKTAYTEAIANLKAGLTNTNARTLGEYLWLRFQETPENKNHLRKPIKFRYEKNTESPDPIFPLREMVEHEFDLLWASQSRYNPSLTADHRDCIRSIIFHQNPLKPQPKGKCQLIPTEDRAPKAHPLFQEFRIRQDLNNMKLINNFTNEVLELSQEQYELLYDSLNQKHEMTFKAMRKLLFRTQADDYRFNLETNNREKLLGNQTHHEIMRKGNELVAECWHKWDEDTRNRAMELIISDLDDAPLLSELQELGISGEPATKLLELHLPSDYCHLSLKAMEMILPGMRNRMVYSDACQNAGFNHSLEYDGRIYDEGNLPYYGELLRREAIELNRKIGDEQADQYGKINNPTVHIALNQLRKVVNAICVKYGAPQEIILELGKEIKMGMAEKERLEKLHRKNRKINEMVDELLCKCDVPPNANNRLKAKLWLELGANEIDRRCVYTGQQINITDLFSSKIEIDHILPKSRTYDDSSSNKILCFREANRYKAERSPYEAFGDSKEGYNWEDIVTRANNLPDNKLRRFQKDAMDRYRDQEEVLARMLNDTRYMSRVAMKYMFYICGDRKVSTITGLHTGLLRGKWGLNDCLGEGDIKNRNDHRHHAIDAFVIALTTRSMVQKLAHNIEQSRVRFIEKLDLPYPGFCHESLSDMVDRIKVSYKPDQIKPSKLMKKKQTGGALAEETAYAFVGPDPQNPKYNLYAIRKNIADINEKNYEDIADPHIRQQIADMIANSQGSKFSDLLKDYASKHNIKKVKLLLSLNPKSMIPVTDKNGKAFKYLSSDKNLFADIYIKDPKAPNPQWAIEIVNSYQAHQPGFMPQWKKDYPKAKKVMRVFKNDIIALDSDDGARILFRIKQLSKNSLFVREINLIKKPDVVKDDGDQKGMRELQKKRARKAGIDIIGRVFDPIVNEP